MSVYSWFLARLRPSDAEGRLAPMDGMRGIAVLLVFLIHYSAIVAAYLTPGSLLSLVATAAARVGFTGVNVFFALSGFLIYGGIVRKKTPYRVFLFKRARRIYPTFLIVLTAYVVLSAVYPSESKIPHGAVRASTYVLWNVLLLPGIFPIPPILTVAWTLSYEFCFYLSVPILVGVLGMRRWKPEQRFIFLALGIAAFAASARFGLIPYGEMIMFGAGMLAFELSRSARAEKFCTSAAEAFTLALLALTFFLIGKGTILPGLQEYLLFLCLGLTIWFAGKPGSVVSRALSSRALRLIGTVSYSYYLIHGLVLNFIRLVLSALLPRSLQTETFACVLFPIALAATVAVACLLFVTVEYPLSVRAGRTDMVPVAEAQEPF